MYPRQFICNEHKYIVILCLASQLKLRLLRMIEIVSMILLDNLPQSNNTIHYQNKVN